VNRIPPRQSRRELFRTTLRYSALGIVAVAGGLTIAKRQRLVSEGRCTNNGMCQGCAVLAHCGLPAALDMKETLGRGDNGRSK
jgi:hypothetical protein